MLILEGLKKTKELRKIDYVLRHTASGELTTEHVVDLQNYAEELGYPTGETVFGGSDKDFLHCFCKIAGRLMWPTL